jgi:polyhydroxybutyrate depolymerase
MTTTSPLAAFLLLLLLTACSAAAQPAPASGKFSDEKMQHDGRERRFLVHDYSTSGPAPVVVVLHGGGGHPENGVDMSQMDTVAARERFIAFYPGGTGGTPG